MIHIDKLQSVQKRFHFLGERKIPPISSTVLTWKLGSFSALSDCKSPTLRVADHFVNCCCAASSAFRIFSFYSVRCGFLDEFDFSCFRVFLCLQIDYYFAYSVKINQKWSRFLDFLQKLLLKKIENIWIFAPKIEKKYEFLNCTIKYVYLNFHAKNLRKMDNFPNENSNKNRILKMSQFSR